jgi:hypothetical protein
MKTKSIIIFIIFITNYSTAQNLTYSGIIIDNVKSNNQYIILLKNTKDTILNFSEVTTNKKFTFVNLPIGRYEISVLFEKEVIRDTVYIHKSSIDNKIEIKSPEKLEEVLIVKKKKLIENKSGVLIINVENSAILSNGSVFDVLSKMPGISYNMTTSTFRLKGKEGIQIQIDSQALYLTKSELSDYLKIIPADDISKVEINSSPSAKYDASGSGGIINIITKKNKREGFFTGISLSGTQGKYYDQDTGVKIQFNNKKNRYLIHYTNSFGEDFEEASTNRYFNLNNTNQYTFAKIKGNTNTINSQIEHEFKKSKLLFISSFSFYNENVGQDTNLDFFSNSLTKDSTLISKQNSKNAMKDYTIGLNYDINFKKSKLTIREHFINYKIKESSDLSSYLLPTNINYNNLINESPKKIDLLLTQIDYENKIDSLSNIEAGGKLVFQKIENQNNFYEKFNNQIVSDYQKSNDYKYREWIFGSYIQYKKIIRKFDFTIGSRFELSQSNGESLKDKYYLLQNQTNFFPFFNVSYNKSDNSDFNLSYSKRINRAAFDELIPFTYFVDNFTQLTGNPNLSSNLTHQIEFQYLFKENYIFSLAYTFNKDQIFQTPIQDSNNSTTILKPYNINNGNSISFNYNLTFDVIKNWNLSLNGNLFYIYVKSYYDNLNINATNLSNQLSITNQINLPKNIKLEIAVNYNSATLQGPYRTKDILSFESSISKSFLNKKLKVSFIGNDIFKTYKENYTSIIENQRSILKHQLNTNTLTLSIVYRFSKGLKKDIAEDDNLSEEIKSRVK